MTYDELVAKKHELQGQADEINKQIAMIDNKLTYAKHAKAEKILDEIIKKVSELRPIVFDDFNKAIRKVRGTLTENILKQLEKWNQEFGALGN